MRNILSSDNNDHRVRRQMYTHTVVHGYTVTARSRRRNSRINLFEMRARAGKTVRGEAVNSLPRLFRSSSGGGNGGREQGTEIRRRCNNMIIIFGGTIPEKRVTVEYTRRPVVIGE